MAAGASRGRLRAIAWPRVDLRAFAGLALVAVAVAGGLTLWQQAQVTVPVVVAVGEIVPGHVIERADLAVAQARLEGPLAALTIAGPDLDAVVGRTSVGRVHAGALMLRPDIGSGPVIGPDQVAVTVPVQADAVYARMRRGDEVAVMATSDKGKPQSLTVPLLTRATVFDVALEPSRVSLGGSGNPEESGRLTNVTLVIQRAQAERVAHAVVNAQLTLLLLAPQPEQGAR